MVLAWRQAGTFWILWILFRRTLRSISQEPLDPQISKPGTHWAQIKSKWLTKKSITKKQILAWWQTSANCLRSRPFRSQIQIFRAQIEHYFSLGSKISSRNTKLCNAKLPHYKRLQIQWSTLVLLALKYSKSTFFATFCIRYISDKALKTNKSTYRFRRWNSHWCQWFCFMW